MTPITRPLDAAAAYALSEISSWAAEELAARIAAKSIPVEVGTSNASCSRYVDVRRDDVAICVRISDHEAMSYNRAGNYSIALNASRNVWDASEIVGLTKLYSVDEYVVVESDEDGEPLEWERAGSTLTENPDADDAEFEGYRVDVDALLAAIDRAEAFILARAGA